MRALWIEDHQLIAESLQMLVQVVMPEISLDKARDVDTATRLLGSIRYELVLLDWWLNGSDGASVIKALRATGCCAPVVVVSGDEREAVMRSALEAGAAAYVPKSAPPAALVSAIRDVLAGVVQRPRRVRGADFSDSDAPLPALDVRMVFPDLTERQADVFRRLMKGESDKQIARDLGLSDTTVKTHVRAILQIVGVHSRGAATYAARSRGAGAN
jgi:two-component system, NarL family, nitrate/nitrite response regulator NarL